MTRVGLVGAGPWATMFHAPMLAAAPRLELAVVWARRAEAAAALADRFGLQALDSFDELLTRCDAVAFAVPPAVQAALAVRAAEAGRHLLLEKPVATTLADAERVAAAVDRTGVRSQVVLTIRYRPEVRAFLRTVVPETVTYVRGSFVGNGALAGSPFSTPWRQSPEAGLLDVGPHTFDLLEAVAGPVTEVRAAVRGGVTTASTVHRYGAVGQVALSITTPEGPGGVDLDVVTRSGFVTMPSAPADEASAWRVIADEFATTIESGEPHPLDVHHGVHLQRVLDAVSRSAATGRTVVL
jgi:predicted dehydrogenase